ncbi:hypothetical protein HMPREF3036_00609 [Sutterella sp. KLE1602]|nr:hypothetical protein HMPREF3036_00609 [Sutterella sp. KLE1602]DAM58107.1 MAG TPA: hypothetical protein [Caudoviricetes sp.]
MCRSGGSLGQIPKPGHLQARGFCVHPGSLTHNQQKGHSRALARAITSRQFFRARASECLFFFSEAS